jgi:2-polyprenyl-6-hydroxyphenyl methylase / 3-demethylubiquinone-9 3-methyltransferase
MESTTRRLQYDASHWTREQDESKALEQYLRLGDLVFNRTAIELLRSMTGEVSGKRILDYGGGAGIMTVAYARAGADVVLVDAEANALRTAQYYARREGVENRIRTIRSEVFPSSLRNERFDIVLAKDVIEHIEDDQQFLDGLSACQHRGGILLLSTQNSRSLNYLLEGTYQKHWCGNTGWCGWDQTHRRFYTAASLGGMLGRAGYRAERWASVYLIPYNILSWLFLLKLDIELPALRYCDLSIGRIFPFNRLGWNIIARAVREA